MQSINLNITKESILKTIVFFDLFDHPLTAEEIKDALYGYGKPIHIKEIKGNLKELTETGKVEEIKDYFVLKGRAHLPETRKARKFISEKLWNRVKLYSGKMQHMPFVRMVAVCNNLSYDNASEASDIDLLIAVEPGHLWAARFFVTVLLHFFGVRRHGNKIAGRFCLSFFVTTQRLNMNALQMAPEDPYLAYWTKTLSPVTGEKTYIDFQQANQKWLQEKYGLTFGNTSRRHLYDPKKSWLKSLMEFLFGNWFEAILKKTLKKKTLQSQSALGGSASVVVSDEMLKFHNHDRRKEYYEQWNQKFHEVLTEKTEAS